MRRILSTALVVFFAFAPVALAQQPPADPQLAPAPGTPVRRASLDAPQRQAAEDAEIYYAVRRQTLIYRSADSSRAYMNLGFREPVYLLKREGNWSQIRTQDGAIGYVPSSAVSNVWIRISKSRKQLYVYRGTELLEKMPADFGFNAFADKERRGSLTNPDDWRTPNGVFFIARKNPNSKFYKALVLNYPTAEDAERGRRQGLISAAEYAAIVKAEESFSMPPMNTALGGMIEIHGRGSGIGSNWTQGCVAVRDPEMDQLYRLADVGTPVLIED